MFSRALELFGFWAAATSERKNVRSLREYQSLKKKAGLILVDHLNKNGYELCMLSNYSKQAATFWLE